MAATEYHEPVLLHEAVRSLVTRGQGIYVDATLGGGGHAKVILSALGEQGRVFGIDHDDQAWQHASGVIGDDPRFTFIRGNFGFMEQLLPLDLHGHIDGILLDLGVSSHQIDEPERGFMFREDAPLDMRMSSLFGTTAHDVVNYYSEQQLKRIFRDYGEERNSGRIAREIVAQRPLETTGQLRQIIAGFTPERYLNKSLARIFQALRIEVNRELEMLERFFEYAPNIVSEKGRLVIISYHSLEDRIAKNYIKAGNAEGRPAKDFYGNTVRPWKPVNKKPVIPDADEISRNPRARSAKMRIAERTGVAS